MNDEESIDIIKRINQKISNDAEWPEDHERNKPMQVLVDVKELSELRELRDLIRESLQTADKEELYIGLGYDANRPRPQEGPKVKRMREIVLPGTHAI